jgi:hypothetical protein
MMQLYALALLAPDPTAEAQAFGKLDFKGDTRKAFCAKTGKGCPAP